MRRINRKPYALFVRKDEIIRILPKDLAEEIKDISDSQLCGIIIDIKAFDVIRSEGTKENIELFYEYAFGRRKEQKIKEE